MSFTHRDASQDEALWLEALGHAPDLSVLLPGPPDRLLVLAAHPDDETLGAGGLIAALAAAGTSVDVIVATAGEGSHPDSGTHTPGQLAEIREQELRAAVTALAPGARVRLLGLPDGGLAGCREALAQALRETADAGTGTLWITAPWRGDGHTDHDSAGEAAAEFARSARIPLLEYPIWLWHWGTPEDIPPALHVYGLDDEAARAKRTAMAAHSSQVEPLSDQPGDEVLLSPEVLAHFERPFEAFLLTVPRSARGVFEELYERSADPWNFQASFYESRKRALTLAMLPREHFGRVFEPGCSIGVLTEELARRADTVTAMDISARALRLAEQRLEPESGVELLEGSIPENWPGGTFDLVVISEIGYFLTPAQLADTVERAAGSLARGGALLLCHWRHPNEGWPLTGDGVHDAFLHSSGLERLSAHVEEDFRIDVLVHPPAESVARREGLL
ncbi:bifunctional PIG-L family deacetylase/class I SAM-dependent methyltransferase [Arthrobacter gandavensis]|uniref:PIG-L family deacetylase n=1 Tax=Arthrobacter gandavensis TaxID=169960 RepID=UPI00188EC193|nr:PIG-L family deacetylase [Arthrobacter gandavensis]MBF4994610.1 bifunctional PIG-L family deacetylase/class I SAM-dependent methyltransferase [Arthrobacter gandavensis]